MRAACRYGTWIYDGSQSGPDNSFHRTQCTANEQVQYTQCMAISPEIGFYTVQQYMAISPETPQVNISEDIIISFITLSVF